MIRYFKKSSPRTKVMLAEGAYLQFTLVDNNTGIFATQDEKVLAQMDVAIANQRGGITEISHDEFRDLNEKKKQHPLTRQWREEFSIRPVPTQLSGFPAREVAGVADIKPTTSPDAGVQRPTATKH